MLKHGWLSLILLCAGCGKSLPVLENVDLKEWKSDKNGCLGKRAAMEVALSAQKEKILTLSETQVIQLLGRPDQNELYKRNQKFYSYFITPAPACDSPSLKSTKLVIRFNAMGLAKEVAIE